MPPLTRRQRIIELLSTSPLGPRQLATLLRVPIKLIEDDLEHISSSLGKRLVLTPAECRSCGYVFKRRTRLLKPSRCPICRSERIDEPLYRVEDEA